MAVREAKPKDAGSRTDKPGLKSAAVANAPSPPEVSPPELIFFDQRSGRDRREEQGRTYDSRRVNGERRRSNTRLACWWLGKNYVDSHQFSIVASESGNPGQSVGVQYK